MHGIDICAVVDIPRVMVKEYAVSEAKDDFLPSFELPAVDDNVAIWRADCFFMKGDGQRFEVRATDDCVFHKPYHLR